MYHACCNGGGLHIGPSECGWQWQHSDEIEVLIDSIVQRSAVMHGSWIQGEVPCEGFQHSKDPTLVVYAIQDDKYTKMVGVQDGQVVEPPRAKCGDRQLTHVSVSDSWDSADTQVSNTHLLKMLHD